MSRMGTGTSAGAGGGGGGSVTQGTSPWVDNITQIGGASFSLGQQLAAASLPIVLTASQLSTLTPLSTIAATQSGTWNIATLTTLTGITNVVHVDDNSGSLTVDNTGTFAVQATLAAETTKVIGVTRTADGAGNLLTSNSTVTSGKFGLDSNILSILGTAPTTAGFLDIKGADGNVFVRNATAANFLANVTLQTQTDTVMVGGVNIKEINAVTPLMGNGVTGTGSQRVTIASDNTPFPVKLDQTTPGTTNAVSIAQIGGTTIVNGGVAGSQSVGGTVATNVAITANPLNLGAQAVSSENTAVTTARQVQLVADLVGKLIVLPYANPENFVSGAITSAMTGTTSTSLIAAPAAGLRNYITQITVSNSHATVGTDIIIQDGSGGTTLYTIPAAAVYGGAVVTFPTPLRQPTTATAIYCANVTTGASTKVSASGYKGS